MSTFQPTRHSTARRIAASRTEKDNWQTQCKGHGDDLKNLAADRIWTTEDMKEKDHPVARNLKARSLCSGCPVFDTCAAETLRLRDHAVVRAGLPLAVESNGVELYMQYDELRKHLGYPHGAPFDLRECRVCGTTMSENNFPDTVAAHSKILCINCYNQRVKEQGS